MSDLEKYLTSPKLKKRLRFLCHKYGKQQFFEDIYHDYVVWILEGKGSHQRLDDWFIDYSRKQKWCKRKEVKLSLPRFSSFDDSLHENGDEREEFDFEPLESLKGSERGVGFLYFKYRLKQDEIAEIYQVVPSRIAQVLTDIKRRLYANQ